MEKLDLGKEKISKLILSFSIPCVISMLINSIYNIVDQIFIGKGVGTLGNAATNVIFPLIIIFNAFSSLIGNGAAANLSLKLGEGNKKDANKQTTQAITFTILMSVLLSIISYIALPKLVLLFGCTQNAYNYALEYGRIICIGAPFVMIYSSLSNIIRADGSPKYSMIMLIIGAIINIILDPIFIFTFDLGVKGGAIATVIGEFVSFVIAMCYLKKFKTIKVEKENLKIDKSILKILALGLSSFITQCTVLVLFVFMNNMMTTLGASSKYGMDIPLSAYGVISKINSIYISSILGISIGAQPIIGFNYGAGNYDRVKETIKKVLALTLHKGIYGLLYAGCISDFICFIIAIFIVKSEYKKLDKKEKVAEEEVVERKNSYDGKHIVITISRQYASGGRYVGKILANKLGINFYDKELILLASKESGLSQKYISKTDESKRKNENDDRIFIAESKVIKRIAKKESCVIVGRCADYILKDNKDVLKVFLYSSDEAKIKRAVKYYGLNSENALSEINRVNKEREKHYKFYTGRNWIDMNNYDLMINVDLKGTDTTAEIIKEYLEK